MKLKLTIILTFLLSFSGNCQSWEVDIRGTVTEINGTEPVGNLTVIVRENADTLASLLTDSSGKFSLRPTFYAQNEYSLQLIYGSTDYSKLILHEVGDTIKMDYQFDMSVYKKRVHRYDPSVYYELDKVKPIQKYESEWFKSLLDEYPGMCLRFVQVINPQESNRIAKKRIEHFKTELEKANCDMSRIRFLNEVKYLSIELLELDSRSRIQGAVTSLEGDCK